MSCKNVARGLLGMLLVMSGHPAAAADAPRPVGVVSHVKVLSDKVADVSSLEAWKKSFICDGMSDEEKAIAMWKSSVAFVYQDAPPVEFLHEGCVHDAIKEFNVYGYGMCCCASARVEQLARYLGLPARGQSINAHSVPEVFWDNQWHMLDASLVNYFTPGRRPDRQPGRRLPGRARLARRASRLSRQRQAGCGNSSRPTDGRVGRKGPRCWPIASSTTAAAGGRPKRTAGIRPCRSTTAGARRPSPYEYGYSQGYEVNIQFRRGERLVRNWFNQGLHVNGILHDGGTPGCLTAKVGEGPMAFLRGYGDLTDGRIGSGRLEYDVPLADGSFRWGAIEIENIACRGDNDRGPTVHLQDAKRPGHFDIEMPTSYVYLTGQIEARCRRGVEAAGCVCFSATTTGWIGARLPRSTNRAGKPSTSGSLPFAATSIDSAWCWRAKRGAGISEDRARHSVFAAGTADVGSRRKHHHVYAGPSEGTVTIEGSTEPGKQDKQVTPINFHPVLKDVAEQQFRAKADGASVTFAIATPGEMTRLRMGGHYRLRDQRDRWDLQVSFDGGQTFKTVDTQTGSYQGICKYVTVGDVPPGVKAALVRWVGSQRNTACIFLLRIDADYRQPHGGFQPVRITYVWEEGGLEKKDIHVAASPQETYQITCQGKPSMKSITLELAE